MKNNLFRALGAVLLALLTLTPSAYAQTATTTTTTTAAIPDSSSTVVLLTSATNVNAGGKLFIDRESMDVISVNGLAARVRRGMDGTRAVPHITASLVYVASATQKAGVYRSLQARGGTCVRANEPFLPQIDTVSAVAIGPILWDCPVGATVWTMLNLDTNTVRSESFDIDNGAGTTVDVLLIRHPRPIVINACRIVYSDATVGTAAAGNAKVGITVGGAEVVAATAYTNSATVGSTTAMVIVEGRIAAGVPVLVRHTGVATTVAGRSQVECDYSIR